MSENKKVKEAIKKVDDFMSEDEARELAELREKWQLDYDSSISYATKKGYEEGHAAGIADGHAQGLAEGHAEGRTQGLEQGIKQGIKQGIEQGRTKGRAEGELNAKIIIAKKLIKKNSDLQEIVELTGLSEYEILKLKK